MFVSGTKGNILVGTAQSLTGHGVPLGPVDDAELRIAFVVEFGSETARARLPHAAMGSGVGVGEFDEQLMIRRRFPASNSVR